MMKSQMKSDGDLGQCIKLSKETIAKEIVKRKPRFSKTLARPHFTEARGYKETLNSQRCRRKSSTDNQYPLDSKPFASGANRFQI
jgi:hypothetical protein